MLSNINERANGRWFGILSALGVETRYLRNRHGPCPVCGGRDRYRWDNKEGKGTFYCSNCGSGDGFRLLQNLKGWDFKLTVQQVETVIGKVKREEPKKIISADEQRDAMKKIWSECVSVLPSDPVSKYLANRGVKMMDFPSVIRSSPYRPAMVALMQAPDARATMIHTTLLTIDGKKADVERPRLMMHGSIADGSAVRLSTFVNELGIAEGIETALSATALTGIPCWAALNEALLQKWKVPTAVEKVVIFGDNDENYVGQSAAYMLARKISFGKTKHLVEVMIPDVAGYDWNDVLLKR